GLAGNLPELWNLSFSSVNRLVVIAVFAVGAVPLMVFFWDLHEVIYEHLKNKGSWPAGRSPPNMKVIGRGVVYAHLFATVFAVAFSFLLPATHVLAWFALSYTIGHTAYHYYHNRTHPAGERISLFPGNLGAWNSTRRSDGEVDVYSRTIAG